MGQGMGAWRPAGLFATVLLLALPTAIAPARAFGTIGLFGQNHEHQRITRLALAGRGLEARTLDMLAGTDDDFGAVGQADAPWRGLMSVSQAHCDNGDYLDVAGYPQTRGQAQDTLTACRDWIFGHMEQAVVAAGGVETPTVDGARCRFGAQDDAKCRVLGELGLALHAAQDFYAHSNWSDAHSDHGSPAGLDQSGPAPWLDPVTRAPFPPGLVTGCWKGVVEALNCGRPRIRHADLNKDNGMIDVKSGMIGPGTTPRGRVNDNFRRAVTAAIADTTARWLWFERRVLAVYGETRGRTILCRIKHDVATACAAGGAA